MKNLFGSNSDLDVKPFFIAEVGQSHEGSLGMAHAFIDAAAEAGADAIKFQTHIAREESTPSEPWRKKFSTQDITRFDYWKRMEFSEDQWRELATHANELSIHFCSSPFSKAAVQLLERVGVPFWKVGSGEVTSGDLLEEILNTRKPIVLSSGLSEWSDLDVAVNYIRSRDVPFAVLQCTSMYPCPPENVGLNIISELAQRYDCVSGYSDHSGDIFAALAAVTLGAKIIEVHVTFSKSCFGPDVTSSITFEQLSTLIKGARYITTCLKNPISKETLNKGLQETKSIFEKKIIFAHALAAGDILTEADLQYKKAAGGITYSLRERFIGKQLCKNIDAQQVLLGDEFE